MKKSKGNEKLTDFSKQVTRSHYNKGSEIKFLEDVMKKNKSNTAKRRRLKKSTTKAEEKT